MWEGGLTLRGDRDYRAGFLKDSAYVRGAAPMTKEEVRWLSLLKLKIGPEDRVLDIGAGTGSVTVGAALLASKGTVIAVERNPEALALIYENARNNGVDNVNVIEGNAPEVLGNCGSFDGIFIGGSGGNMGQLIQWCSDALVPGGRLVINTVTIENAAEALKSVKEANMEAIETIQVSVSKGRNVGSVTLWEAQNPVMILSAARRMDER